MKRFYPVFLDVEGRKAVVIGGGPVAARKAATLHGAGAEVTVISPELGPELAKLLGKGAVRHEARKYRAGDLAGAFVVVAATGDPEANEEAAREAKAEGVLINCARPPEAGDFIVPSSIRRGGLTVAISTGGGCPALSKRLRKDLDEFFGREYGGFLEFLEEARALLKEKVPSEEARQEALTALVESGLAGEFREGGREGALRKGREMLEGIIARLKP